MTTKNNQKMGKHSVKKAKQQDPKLQALAKRKKEMKVFKLPTDMSKRINKKAKKVTSNLKKVRNAFSVFGPNF